MGFPQCLRMVLASSGEMTLDTMAQLADKVMEVALPSSSTVNVAPLTSEVVQLRAEVERLHFDHSIQINPSKYILGVDSLEFLAIKLMRTAFVL